MAADSPAEVVGRRIGAALIDLVMVFLLMLVIGLLFGQTYSGSGRAGVRLHGASVAVWGIVSLGYYFLSEAFFGQTLGKRLLGLRVVSRNGGGASASAIAARTLLRIVDFLPILYLVGLLCILFTRERAQRLGDLAAGTTVGRSPAVGGQPVSAQ